MERRRRQEQQWCCWLKFDELFCRCNGHLGCAKCWIKLYCPKVQQQFQFLCTSPKTDQGMRSWRPRETFCSSLRVAQSMLHGADTADAHPPTVFSWGEKCAKQIVRLDFDSDGQSLVGFGDGDRVHLEAHDVGKKQFGFCLNLGGPRRYCMCVWERIKLNSVSTRGCSFISRLMTHEMESSWIKKCPVFVSEQVAHDIRWTSCQTSTVDSPRLRREMPTGTEHPNERHSLRPYVEDLVTGRHEEALQIVCHESCRAWHRTVPRSRKLWTRCHGAWERRWRMEEEGRDDRLLFLCHSPDYFSQIVCILTQITWFMFWRDAAPVVRQRLWAVVEWISNMQRTNARSRWRSKVWSLTMSGIWDSFLDSW